MPLTRSLNLQININRDRRKMEGNITGSAVITFCESFTKCHWSSLSSWIAMTSCHDYPVTSSAPNSG
jgi:hypothetical protein